MYKKKPGYNFLELFLFGLLLLMVFFTIFAVFTRYVLNQSLDWTEELARFLYIWITFLGALVVLAKNKHIAIETLLDALPKKVSSLLRKINVVLMISFTLSMIIGGWQVSKMAMFQVAPGTGIRLGYVYAVIPLSGVLMLLYLVFKGFSRDYD